MQLVCAALDRAVSSRCMAPPTEMRLVRRASSLHYARSNPESWHQAYRAAAPDLADLNTPARAHHYRLFLKTPCASGAPSPMMRGNLQDARYAVKSTH